LTLMFTTAGPYCCTRPLKSGSAAAVGAFASGVEIAGGCAGVAGEAACS
jgi:hypothetical protein